MDKGKQTLKKNEIEECYLSTMKLREINLVRNITYSGSLFI